MLGLVILDENFNYLEKKTEEINLESIYLSESYLNLQENIILNEGNIFSKIKDWILEMWEKIKSFFSSSKERTVQNVNKLKKMSENFEEELSKCPETQIEFFMDPVEKLNSLNVKSCFNEINNFSTRLNKLFSSSTEKDLKSQVNDLLDDIDDIVLIRDKVLKNYKKENLVPKKTTMSGKGLLKIIKETKPEKYQKMIDDTFNENKKLYQQLLKTTDSLNSNNKFEDEDLQLVTRVLNKTVSKLVEANNSLSTQMTNYINLYIQNLRKVGLQIIAENRKNKQKKLG